MTKTVWGDGDERGSGGGETVAQKRKRCGRRRQLGGRGGPHQAMRNHDVHELDKMAAAEGDEMLGLGQAARQ